MASMTVTQKFGDLLLQKPTTQRGRKPVELSEAMEMEYHEVVERKPRFAKKVRLAEAKKKKERKRLEKKLSEERRGRSAENVSEEKEAHDGGREK